MTSPRKWQRLAPGSYRLTVGADVYTIEDVTEDVELHRGERARWLVRLNHEAIDCFASRDTILSS